MAGYIGQLLMPDIAGAVQQGFQQGQDMASKQTLAKYMQGAVNGDSGALAKVYQADPSAGIKAQQLAAQGAKQASALKDQDMARLGKHARMITALADSGDMQGAASLYSTIYPEASKILGPGLPQQFDPSMLPHMKHIADAVDPQKPNYVKGAPGDVFVDTSASGKPAITVPGDKAPPQSIQELQYLQQHPDLLGIKKQLAAAGRAPAGDSALQQRLSLARSMGATPEQLKQMVMGTSATTDANTPLSEGGERMASALAKYQLPAGARFISTKANRAIVQRALELNPQLSTANYDQSHKFLQDLSSNSPTSAGGVITAAKTAINHLSDLADLSDKLPSHMGFINAGENMASSIFNGDNANTLKEWNVAKSKVAAEVLKMVKGGQINEAESKEMINDLDPNSPNRNAAIATLAKLMTDKTAAMEDKRDAILGANSPHTSYLSASDQKKAIRLIGLSKNLDLPQFSAPGGYGQAVPGTSGSPQPANKPSEHDPLGIL
jgi:polyhydroxyalkanoate synthesis regulator phasin